MSNATIKEHYQDDAVAEYYDRERFSSFVGRTFDSLEKRALQRSLQLVRREIAAPSVLDVPCGTGRVTELWLENSLSVVGGDISQQMIAVAERKCARFGGQVTFRQLDLDHLDISDDSFDLVTCVRLFHHLASAERAPILRELARVTRRYVMINVSLSTAYYRMRRRLKRFMRQGVSRTSSTWEETFAEAEQANLVVRSTNMVFPGVSEDLVILLEKRGKK